MMGKDHFYLIFVGDTTVKNYRDHRGIVENLALDHICSVIHLFIQPVFPEYPLCARPQRYRDEGSAGPATMKCS